jgi:hypothetical protein
MALGFESRLTDIRLCLTKRRRSLGHLQLAPGALSPPIPPFGEIAPSVFLEIDVGRSPTISMTL